MSGAVGFALAEVLSVLGMGAEGPCRDGVELALGPGVRGVPVGDGVGDRPGPEAEGDGLGVGEDVMG